MSWYPIWMLTRREMARYMNVWGQTLVPPVVSAALFLFVFGHALADRIGNFGGVDYLTFLVPGLIVQGAITNAYNNSASSLFDARRAGYIDDVLTSPLTDRNIVLAYMLGGTTRGMFIGVLTYIIALPIADMRVQWLPFLLVMMASCAIFALLGLLIGLRATRWDHIFVPMTFFLTPLTFLGGVFYPVDELRGNLATVSKFNPILYIVDAQRATSLPNQVAPVWLTITAMALATIVLFVYVSHRFATSGKLRS